MSRILVSYGIKLRHLNESDRMVVQDMLHEECQPFSESDDDIGCIEKLRLNILLKDMYSAARTYLSVPKPLYKEIKDYQHNLIESSRKFDRICNSMGPMNG